MVDFDYLVIYASKTRRIMTEQWLEKTFLHLHNTRYFIDFILQRIEIPALRLK